MTTLSVFELIGIEEIATTATLEVEVSVMINVEISDEVAMTGLTSVEVDVSDVELELASTDEELEDSVTVAAVLLASIVEVVKMLGDWEEISETLDSEIREVSNERGGDADGL